MQGMAAKNDASYDLSRARASVTGQTTIAASIKTHEEIARGRELASQEHSLYNSLMIVRKQREDAK
jgi:hypothetical protein